MLTQERLKSVLSYNPETGVFTWIEPIGRAVVGARAGGINAAGYRTIGVFGKRYRSNRLAFFWMTGVWPQHIIDHHDRNTENDRWENLREATPSQNNANQKARVGKKCRLKGVFPGPKGVFYSQIATNNRSTHLGTFRCPAAAYFAYIVAADKLYGEFARF